jgi:hypothetical protein
MTDTPVVLCSPPPVLSRLRSHCVTGHQWCQANSSAACLLLAVSLLPHLESPQHAVPPPRSPGSNEDYWSIARTVPRTQAKASTAGLALVTGSVLARTASSCHHAAGGGKQRPTGDLLRPSSGLNSGPARAPACWQHGDSGARGTRPCSSPMPSADFRGLGCRSPVAWRFWGRTIFFFPLFGLTWSC